VLLGQTTRLRPSLFLMRGLGSSLEGHE
jgi:hypothetical protein